MRTRLRALLTGPELVIAPGVYDGLSAHLVRAAGYPVAYLTGAGTAAALGFPDVGLATQTELAQHAARIVEVLDVPLVVDADTGFGNELNTYRTVRELQRAGVAAIQLEDQGDHRRCGHLAGKSVVDAAVFEAKLAAALEAREDPDLVLIARTDARAPEGFDAALLRAKRYRAAGADMIFFEAPESLEEIERVAGEVEGPLMFNVVARGKTPPVGRERLAELGYRLAIVPGVTVKAAAEAMRAALDALATPRGWAGAQAAMSSAALFRLVGLDTWDERADRWTAR
jgi:2-methylisocitrate lyase-like PEP mutase family enzyme